MNTRRTCDRCYKIKARCIYDDHSNSCARCTRLGHACQTKRAVLRAGRPRASTRTSPASGSDVSTSELPFQHQDVIRLTPEAQHLPVLIGFEQHEISLVEFILHPDQIASLMYGKTFQDDMRSLLLKSLVAATDKLKDAFLAFAQALSDNKQIHIRDLAQYEHAGNSSRALQKLRQFETSTLADAQVALGLALFLVTYNDLKVGAPTLPISRSALLRAMPWQTRLICNTTEETDPNIICLLFVEMFECLALCQMPVFRMKVPESSTIIDRYYGISHELLPQMYDVCLLYKEIKDGMVSDRERINRIDQINAEVDAWTPEVVMFQQENAVSDESEWLHFLQQAKAFKMSVQLLLLQAQRSSLSDMLASSKAAQLSSHILYAMQYGPNRPKYLLFPYFLTCVEMNTSNDATDDGVLDTMNEISNGMAPKACQSMLMCLKHIWANKRRMPNLCWFECVDKNLLFGMGP